MKNDDTALNEQGEVANTPTTAPVVEKQASGEVAEQNAEQASPVEEGKTETEESKKGFSNRVRELVKERNEAREEIQSLQQKMAELTQTPSADELKMPDFNVEPIVKPGEELTAEELNRRIANRDQELLRKADAIAQLRTKQVEAMSRIDREAAEVLKVYPQLDPDSEEFNKELSEAITESTEAYVKSNPYSASVKKHVAKLMRPYMGAVTKEVGKATETMAKQASEAALRPTTVRKAEKPASEMTMEELEAKLGVVIA